MNMESVQQWWDDVRGHGRMRQAAWQLLRKRQYEQATELIAAGRKRFPQSISFEILNARIFLLANDRDQASSVLAKVEGIKPRDVFDQFELAETYRLLNQHTEAIELFENLKTTDKLNIALLANQRLTSIFHRLDQPENALGTSLNCARLGGWQRRVLLLQLAQSCSRAAVEKAISQAQATELARAHLDAERMKFIAFLATAIGRWELAIDSIGKATKRVFCHEHDASLWDDEQPLLRPSVLIIGAMKSGTTGLYNQLLLHPQFVRPVEKELHFFTNRDWPEEFYFAQFPRVMQKTPPIMTGEASPGYYIFDIVDRVKKILPDTKIVFIKRNPVDRALSHLFHNQNAYIEENRTGDLIKGMETVLDLIPLGDDALRAELRDFEMERKATNRYLLMGCYELLMRRWRAAYSPGQLLELEFSDFVSSNQETMDRLFEFVGLAPHQLTESFRSNIGKYKKDSVEFTEIRKQLAEFYDQVEKPRQ